METLIKSLIILLVLGVCAFFLVMCVREIAGVVNAVRAYKARRAAESVTVQDGEEKVEDG